MEVVIKEEGVTLFKSHVTNKQAINIINSLKMNDSTIKHSEEKELKTYRAGTNPGD